MSIAVRYYGPRDLRLEEVDAPEPGPDDVLIDVEACGICGSDLHEYAAGPITIPEDPHPVTGEELPITIGHEFAGTVNEAGENADVAEGTRVAVNPSIWCGECRYCLEGNYNRCDPGGFVGLSGGGGGFSEQVAVSKEQVVPVPDGISLEMAALVEPFSCGLHAARRAEIEPGDSVVVFGCGPIGLMTVQAARAAGAGQLFAIEPRDARRKLGAESGADTVIDPTEEDPVEYVKAETNDGADVAIEVAGVEATVNQAIQCTRRGGHVTIVSLFEETISIQPNDIVLAERTVNGSLAYLAGPLADREFDRVLRSFDTGEYDPELLVSSRIELVDIVEGGFERLLDDESDEVKVLVRP